MKFKERAMDRMITQTPHEARARARASARRFRWLAALGFLAWLAGLAFIAVACMDRAP